MNRHSPPHELPRFDRSWDPAGGVSRIGSGEIGGKAQGLLLLREIVEEVQASTDESIDLLVPTFTVIATDVFDAFIVRNDLLGRVNEMSSDERIAHAFQRASLPHEILGDLRALTEKVRWPLAIRSSSRLEDALFRPFAGVYETKMTPNNQPAADTRFQRLVEAIKFVYASTYFSAARDYLGTITDCTQTEKMAVIIQEVVGTAHQDRFYPNLSGVGRSFNFYPMGDIGREDGIVDLALGLGKIIVDDGVSYPYAPSQPKRPPPFASAGDRLRNTQTEFWAVNMGRPPVFDPTKETEYLVRANIADAEYDGVLRYLASTFDPASERIWPGVGRDGPRILDFAPLLLLEEFSFNDAISKLLIACRVRLERDVEIEFAMTFPGARKEGRPRLGCVQVRPMVTPEEKVVVDSAELEAANLLLSSSRVMGNGVVDQIKDVIYVRPDHFSFDRTQEIAEQLAILNSKLVARQRPYLLIGFGRWGSSDPWLGIPVKWGQVSGAKAVVEATSKTRLVEASQGSHFFHNITSFGVSYFHVGSSTDAGIQWDWLESKPAEFESEILRHLRLENPLLVKVDGRSGIGGIWFSE